jgi:hypothetical protein
MGLRFFSLALLACCGPPRIYAPPPPQAGIATSILIVAVPPGGGEPITGFFDRVLDLEAENRTYDLYALSYGCAATEIGTRPHPKPYAVHRFDANSDEWIAVDDLLPLADIVELSPACPTYSTTLVSIPGTEENKFRATVIDTGNTALLLSEQGAFRVDPNGMVEVATELGADIFAGGVRLANGELFLVAPNRTVRWSLESGAIVELPPMIAPPVDAVMASDASGIVVAAQTSTGATLERFDGTRWRPVDDCGGYDYSRVPKPSVSVAEDVLFVFPSEIGSEAPRRLGQPHLYSYDEFGCHGLPPPNGRISAGSLTELGRVVGGFGDSDLAAAETSQFFIERSAASWERGELPPDETGATRGALSAIAPRPNGFIFTTHYGWIGEEIEGTGFCFLEDRPPNLPLEIETTRDGFIVLSKGDYDPGGAHWCEQQGLCRPIHLTFVERTDAPTAECSKAPQ